MHAFSNLLYNCSNCTRIVVSGIDIRLSGNCLIPARIYGKIAPDNYQILTAFFFFEKKFEKKNAEIKIRV